MLKLLKLFTIINVASILISCNSTKVIAHRGFSEIAPENTMIAFKKAIEIKADYFELDVHKTKDDVLVVIHDKTIDRTSSNEKSGKVSELNFNEIQKVKVGYSSKFSDKYKDEKIPTLKEVLQLAKGKIKVCVELKVIGIEKQVVDLLNEVDMTNQVIVFSFNDESLIKIKKLNPKLKTLFLKNDANLKTLDFVKAINANAIGIGYGTELTKEFMDYAKNINIKIFKWTVNNKQEMKKLIDLNIDGIITDRPDLALKLN